MDKIESDVIFKYENNIEIIWNGLATFNVFVDGNNTNCFTHTVENYEQAKLVADEWLSDALQEEMLRHADA